jgi:hypothetical protein
MISQLTRKLSQYGKGILQKSRPLRIPQSHSPILDAGTTSTLDAQYTYVPVPGFPLCHAFPIFGMRKLVIYGGKGPAVRVKMAGCG